MSFPSKSFDNWITRSPPECYHKNKKKEKENLICIDCDKIIGILNWNHKDYDIIE